MSFNRSGYIGRAPGDSSVTIARKSYEPTGVQTDFTFSAGYDPGYCDVYLNGIRLVKDNDFTASDGSTVGLTSAANSGDIVEIIAYKAFNLGQSITDITGDLTISDTLTATNVSGTTSITAGYFYGDGNNLTLTGFAGIGITQYIDANSLTVTGTPGLSTITRLGATDAVVTGIITANGLSGNVTGAACTFTTGTFNGDVSIGGTLSYQDVTNVDAVGLITARSGVNLSGGQLTVGTAYSVGYAGVVTAQNVTISAGTIDLKNSGSVSNIKFYCESSNAHYTALQSAAHSAYGGNVTLTLPTTTDTLVARTTTDTLTNKTLTSPTLTTPVFSGQATGELKVGSGITMAATSGVVTFADGSATSNALHFGSDGDLVIYHDSSESYIHDNGTGGINLKGSYVKGLNGSNEVLFNAIADGAVELYHNNVKTFETSSDGIVVQGTEGGNAAVYLYADEGDDNADKWQLYADDSGNCRLLNYASGSWETNWGTSGNGNVELYYDNSAKLATTNEGIEVTGFTSTTAGMGVTGGLFEGSFIKAGKLSDNLQIGIATANIFYFTTTESTTSTPNIRWNDTYALSSKMAVGDVASVTVVTTAAAAGYAANWTIDGNAVTEVWAGGSAPSSGGSSGLDVYSLTIIRKASGTGDTGWKVIANVTNCA